MFHREKGHSLQEVENAIFENVENKLNYDEGNFCACYKEMCVYEFINQVFETRENFLSTEKKYNSVDKRNFGKAAIEPSVAKISHRNYRVELDRDVLVRLICCAQQWSCPEFRRLVLRTAIRSSIILGTSGFRYSSATDNSFQVKHASRLLKKGTALRLILFSVSNSVFFSSFFKFDDRFNRF